MEAVNSEYITRALISLFVIVALILVLVWWIKVKGPRLGFQEEHQIKVISRTLLDSKHKLLVVEVGEKRFLVATSPSGIAVHQVDSMVIEPKFSDVYSSQVEG